MPSKTPTDVHALLPQATWAASHVYAHKSNHMWRLLIETGGSALL